MLYCVKKMFLSDQKKSSIVSGSRLVENFLITHHPHSRMCIRIYIFNFKNKQTSENKTKNTKKQKKLKKNRDSGKSSKKKFAAARVKIFLITLISGNKNFFTFFCLISITDMSGNISCFERAIFWLTQKARLWCLTPQELKWIIKVLNCSLISATSVAFVTWLSVKQILSFSAVWLCWHL